MVSALVLEKFFFATAPSKLNCPAWRSRILYDFSRLMFILVRLDTITRIVKWKEPKICSSILFFEIKLEANDLYYPKFKFLISQRQLIWNELGVRRR